MTAAPFFMLNQSATMQLKYSKDWTCRNDLTLKDPENYLRGQLVCTVKPSFYQLFWDISQSI